MSSKKTILLTTDNEHWYEDCHEDDAVFLEIDRKHLDPEVEPDEFSSVIGFRIQRGSPLYTALKERLRR